MKPSYFLFAAAAAFAGAACNSQTGGNGESAGGAPAASEAVDPPASGDWTEIVRQTPQGGFAIGNPNAEVKLVEFASMTCPACGAFDQEATPKLVNEYVKSGQVSYEIRNFVRDPFDITATLIARCNGASSFFPLTHALFRDQEKWIGRLQSAPQQQLEAVTNLGPEQQFLQVAQLAGLQQYAAARGVPTAKSSQCLTDQQAVNQLVQMNADATNEYDIPGTPTFLINGDVVEMQGGSTAWQQLDTKIKAALGS